MVFMNDSTIVSKDCVQKSMDMIPIGFCNSLYSLLESYDNAIKFLQSKDRSTYNIFYKWYEDSGSNYICDAVNILINKKLEERFIIFCNIYQSYLEDAMKEEDTRTLLEFLYIVPKSMHRFISIELQEKY